MKKMPEPQCINDVANLAYAAQMLGMNPESLRKEIKDQKRSKKNRPLIPSAKIGKSWRFYVPDLVQYIRSLYSESETSQSASGENQWRSVKEVAAPITKQDSKSVESEYRNRLKLHPKQLPKNTKIAARKK